jgi:hypothetical protein
MMAIEEDSRPEFDFGEFEAKVQEIEELENLVSQFKKFPPSLPSNTKQKCLAAMEENQEPPLIPTETGSPLQRHRLSLLSLTLYYNKDPLNNVLEAFMR